MKSRNLFLILSLIALTGASIQAQTPSVQEAEKQAQSVLSDPRLKNVFRSVKENPDAIIETIDDNADSAVRSATRMFNENSDVIKETVAALPTDRETINTAATSAMSQITRMLPKPPPSSGDVPATRPVNGGTTPPIATPVTEPKASDSMPSPPVAETIIQSDSIQPIPNMEPTAPSIPDSPLLTGANVPAPQPLAQKYKTDPGGGYQSNGKPQMIITSQESVMDNQEGIITFLGNVEIDHPEFDISCDKLVIYLSDGETTSEEGSFRRAIATGGMVEIRRKSPEGKIQIALARRADYDGITKDIVLTGGPPQLQDGEKSVKTNSEDSKITMTGDGKYKVTGSDAGVKVRNTIIIPIDNDGKSDSIGLGSGLGTSLGN